MAYDALIARAPPEAICDLRGASAALSQLLGECALPVPLAANSIARQGQAGVMWLGPQWWLARAPLNRETEIAAALNNLAADAGISAVLVSDLYTRFDIGGPDADEVLAQATPLDLHPDRFGADAASCSSFFGLPAILWREAQTLYSVLIERSYTDFIEARLLRATG